SPDDAPLNPTTATTCQTAPGNTTCTLRAAIMFANRNGVPFVSLPALPAPGAYRLLIAPAGSDDDSTRDLNLTQSLSILGGGAATTIVDGNQLDRVFHIAAGVSVTLSGLTVRNGNRATNGGGIENEGTLTLNDSTVSGNQADTAGGGIYNAGALTLNRS